MRSAPNYWIGTGSRLNTASIADPQAMAAEYIEKLPGLFEKFDTPRASRLGLREGRRKDRSCGMRSISFGWCPIRALRLSSRRLS
jgi:hypothetical protein